MKQIIIILLTFTLVSKGVNAEILSIMKKLLLKTSIIGFFFFQIFSIGFVLNAQEYFYGGKDQYKKSITDLSYAEGGPKSVNPGEGLTNVYYADSLDGDDNNDGKTPETAWKSGSKIQNSKNLLIPGTMLLLKRGSEWDGTIRLDGIMGTESNPIVIGAYGELHLPNPRIHRDFFFISAEYVMVRDLEFAKINTALGKHITIYNNVVHGSSKVSYYPSNAVMAWGGSSHIAMVSNFVYDVGTNDALVVHGSAEGEPKGHVWIIDNVAIGNSGMEDGVDLAMSESGSATPCIDVKVVGNRVQMEAVPGISTLTGQGGMMINGGHGGKYIWIVGNTMGNSAGQGVKIDGDKDYVHFSGNVFFSAGNKNSKNSVEFYNEGTNNWFTHNTVITTNTRNNIAFEDVGKEVTYNLFYRTVDGQYIGTPPGSVKPIIDYNWYGNLIGNSFGYRSFVDWKTLGYDENSNVGMADGINVPAATSFNKNPFNWNSSDFLSNFIPNSTFLGCKGNDTPGAFDCTGKRLGLVIPPMEGLENDGFGWEGPELVRLKLEELGVIFVQGLTRVRAPIFSPAAGTYTSVQSVVISSLTSDATIRYTTDGTEPTETHGTVYTAPVSISETTTLKAIGYKTGLDNSTITSGEYIIAVSAPDFSLASGIYGSTQVVAITSSPSDATIRYTTDGTDPTETSGTVYTEPVSISETTTLKAIAYKTGIGISSVTSAQYIITTVETVVLSPEADAMVHNGNTDNNYGTSDNFQIRLASAAYRREAFLRFDLRGISGTVSSAVLSLYGTSGYATQTVNNRIAFVSDDTWSETGITWNNKPAADLVNYLDTKFVGPAGVYYDYTITDKVQQELGGKISLNIYALENVAPAMTYASREHATEAFRPKLTVIYSPGLTSSQNIIADPEAKSGNTLDNILVYPNPSSDRLYLHGFTVENTSVQLLDIHGRVVNHASNSNSIELNGVAKGIYFVRIKTAQQIKVFKVFVEN